MIWGFSSVQFSPSVMSDSLRPHECSTPGFLRFSSAQFNHSVVPQSLQLHGLQHTRFPCPSPTSGTYSNSCSSSWWCHPTISFLVIAFSSSLQSFPASGSFPRSQHFASGGQSIGVSTLAPDLPMSIHGWFQLGWTGWIFLNPRDFQESSPTPQFKSINSLVLSFLYSPSLASIHDYWKKHNFD